MSGAWLGIDTATPAVAVAVWRPGRGAGTSRVVESDRRHAEMLVPTIRALLASESLTPADLGAVAVGVGPGLFTGLRVGVATAKAMAHALGIGVAPVSSLDALVRPVAAERVVGVIDARRGEVFWALSVAGRRVGDVHRGPPERLAAALESVGPVVVVGDGARRYRAELTAANTRIEAPVAPDPSAVIELGRAQPLLAPAAVLPDYHRPPDAVIPTSASLDRAVVASGDDPSSDLAEPR